MSGKTVIEQVIGKATAAFPAREITPPQYAAMKYLKWLPMMRFVCRQYTLKGFGNLFTMETHAMGGLMKLSTMVFTPYSGKSVPFLLVDTMEMKKKRLAYVEYYDCTAKGASMPESERQAAEFAALPDYAEKPAWYVSRRTPYSLIKGGEGADDAALEAMILTCVDRYLNAAKDAPIDPDNLPGLRDFQHDMLVLGNPSSGTLNKVLGKEGAELAFKTAIMPVEPPEGAGRTSGKPQ